MGQDGDEENRLRIQADLASTKSYGPALPLAFNFSKGVLSPAEDRNDSLHQQTGRLRSINIGSQWALIKTKFISWCGFFFLAPKNIPRGEFSNASCTIGARTLPSAGYSNKGKEHHH